MKLLSNFYQIASDKLTHKYDSTVFLLTGNKENVLIDCGCPKGYDNLIKNIKSLKLDPSSIKYVFGTHGHYDHVGSFYLFKENFNSTLLLHKDDCIAVETGDGMKTSAEFLYNEKFVKCKIDEKLKGGEKFDFGNFTIEVLHTPGHSLGSVCYKLRMQGLDILVAGDTLYGGFSHKIGSSEVLWKDSLDKLSKIHFDLMVVGHQNPILMADANKRIEDAKNSFAIYYNPWFKNFYDEYRY